jgi:hypothetical protein
MCCLAEDVGEAIYKPIESTALFAVNQASIRARMSSAGCEAPPLNESPTERKYTFSPARINGTGQLIGSLAAYLRCNAKLAETDYRGHFQAVRVLQ